MPEGYCVKERKKVEIKDAKQVTMKNGRPAIQGACPDCGTKIFKIGKLERPRRLNPARFLPAYDSRRGCPSRALTRERDVREAYAAHAGELYGFAVRSLGDSGLAEEAVQETFLRAWRAGDRFDPQIGSLRTWLFAILRNVVIDLGRARAVSPRRRRGRDRAFGRAARGGAARLAGRGGDAADRRGPPPRPRRDLLPWPPLRRGRGGPGRTRGNREEPVYYGLRALRVVLEEMGYED